MPVTAPPDAPLLLAGAGHAHLHLIRHRRRLPAARVILLDPGGFWYSGMASGVLGGQAAPGEDRLDPARLARRHGAEAIRGRLAGLDIERREARLDDGRRLPVAALSLNLGSRVDPPTSPPGGPRVWPVKPIPHLVALRRRLSRDFAAGRTPRLLVVGGGASGIELAANLRALAERHGVRPAIRLVTRGPRLLPDAPAGAAAWLSRHLAERGIEVMTGTTLTELVPGGARLAAGDAALTQPAEHLVHAAGLRPPALLDALGLPTLPGRGLAVTETLQSPAAPWLFAAGDCAAMRDHPLPRLGVYGVRQAPVLRANLAAFLSGGALAAYRPQRRALAILNLGAGQALAIRGRLWWAGRLAMAWKRRLDEGFLAGYR
ncbi:NAD(P)/FAD-dependent oxidoreductase [Halomonas koreensis]|uniref:FAD-dependent oxidoreductase n=1 Tax=Halomonas koreensis TaxID=245385 RepID=A0ABU1FYX8_9GAMM|nr:FAD-dependent oxidoreductase [Halomonas koreensis]MDR5865862.1 FAD-dependent oxidoreductase [Halomonas koreensis]